MWKTYKYIYYWLYTWQKKLWGEEDVPEFNAVAGMTLSFCCNILSVIILLEIFGIKIFPSGIPLKGVILPGLIVLLAHYFLFMYKCKYLKIEKEFKNETKEEHKGKGRWVLLYAFGSLAFFIFLLFFGIWIKQ